MRRQQNLHPAIELAYFVPAAAVSMLQLREMTKRRRKRERNPRRALSMAEFKQSERESQSLNNHLQELYGQGFDSILTPRNHPYHVIAVQHPGDFDVKRARGGVLIALKGSPFVKAAQNPGGFGTLVAEITPYTHETAKPGEYKVTVYRIRAGKRYFSSATVHVNKDAALAFVKKKKYTIEKINAAPREWDDNWDADLEAAAAEGDKWLRGELGRGKVKPWRVSWYAPLSQRTVYLPHPVKAHTQGEAIKVAKAMVGANDKQTPRKQRPVNFIAEQMPMEHLESAINPGQSAYSVAASKGYPYIRGEGKVAKNGYTWLSRFTRDAAGKSDGLYVGYDDKKRRWLIEHEDMRGKNPSGGKLRFRDLRVGEWFMFPGISTAPGPWFKTGARKYRSPDDDARELEYTRIYGKGKVYRIPDLTPSINIDVQRISPPFDYKPRSAEHEAQLKKVAREVKKAGGYLTADDLSARLRNPVHNAERTGTSYFTSLGAAVRYYKDYGYDRTDVQQKINNGEIHIGKPRGDKQWEAYGRTYSGRWVSLKISAPNKRSALAQAVAQNNVVTDPQERVKRFVVVPWEQKRNNPGAPANINALAQMFHGKATGAELDVIVSEHHKHNKHIQRIGRLPYVKMYNRPKGAKHDSPKHACNACAIFFPRRTSWVSMNGRKRLILAGNGVLSVGQRLRKMAEAESPVLNGGEINLGRIEVMAYITPEKHSNSGTPILYYHPHAEESGRARDMPSLHIDRNGMLFIPERSGRYDIDERGIIN